MKKTLATIIISIGFISASAQALKVGDKVPDLLFEDCILPQTTDLLVKNVSLRNFSGNIVLLDFWATWCGPCIASMPKYEALQTKFKDKLQVIGVTHESVKRIQSFSKNRPVCFMLAIDTASRLRKYFDYRSIPHVVLIDQEGIVRAITNSDNITDGIINSVWRKENIDLPIKKDNLAFDIEADHFNADPNSKESFNIQPGIKGVGSMSKMGQGNFTDRRISLINFSIDAMYRTAYRKSFYTTVYEVDKKEFDYKNPSNLYCLDVIAPTAGEGLYTFMQNEIPKHFDVKAKLVKKKMLVTILRRTNNKLNLTKSDTVSKYYGGSSNHFTGNGVAISSLADYLESFGIAGTPVIDETEISGRFDIHMEWLPEKKGDMQEAFRKIGLEMLKEEREMEVLVIYR